jgi:hypothetical protein
LNWGSGAEAGIAPVDQAHAHRQDIGREQPQQRNQFAPFE